MLLQPLQNQLVKINLLKEAKVKLSRFEWIEIIVVMTFCGIVLGSFFWYAWKSHLLIDKLLWG